MEVMMKHSPFAIMCVLFLFVIPAALLHGQSYYPEKPEDPGAVYFTPDNFTIHADGIGDDSDALQDAVTRAGGGILFIPAGRYRITKTIIVGGGTRLIGYGKERPVIVLPANTPSFQWGTGKYMFHFAQYNLPRSNPNTPQTAPGGGGRGGGPPGRGALSARGATGAGRGAMMTGPARDGRAPWAADRSSRWAWARPSH